jgi:hypothetical protein
MISDTGQDMMTVVVPEDVAGVPVISSGLF